MTEIVLKIPEEFEQDFSTDRFKECFERVLADCKAWDYAGISGRDEHETLEMLLNALCGAVTIPKGHGRLIDGSKLKVKLECGIRAGNYEEGYEKYAHINGMDDCIDAVEYADTIIEADKEAQDNGIRYSKYI